MDETFWKAMAATIARKIMFGIATYLTTKGLLASGDQGQFINMGVGILIGGAALAWDWWKNVGHAKLQARVAAMQGVAKTQAQAPSGPNVARVLVPLALVLLGLSLLASPALAAPKNTPALTGHPVEDFQNAIHTAAPSASTGSNAALPCDFNLFANLSAHNLIASIHNCIESKMQSDIIAPLMLDTQAALASAQAYGGTGDTTGINCLKPGLAILQAAAGVTPTPAAAAATQPALSTPAASTSPATSTAPAPSASPSRTEPGPVLLFQKWREFVLAGGPSACKSWVNTTITGGSLLAQ